MKCPEKKSGKQHLSGFRMAIRSRLSSRVLGFRFWAFWLFRKEHTRNNNSTEQHATAARCRRATSAVVAASCDAERCARRFRSIRVCMRGWGGWGGGVGGRGRPHVSCFFYSSTAFAVFAVDTSAVLHYTIAMQTYPNAKKDYDHLVKVLVLGVSGRDGGHS